MSESPTPDKAGGEVGPMGRPHGEGVPSNTGKGMVPDVGSEDSRDPGSDVEGDRGPDTGGMIGEGDDGRDV